MKRKSDIRLFLYSLVVSGIFLLLLSKCSPLYLFNDWVDVHCFFTVGKSMLDGLIPYRDIYEQKGPILYFLFAAAAAISRTSFLGVYLLETLSFSLFLFFSGKCVQLYLGDSRAVYGILLIFAPLVMISTAFLYGGGAEELCLWMLTLSLYLFDRAIHEKRMLRVREAFGIGLCAGVALHIKFTLLGFYLGLAIFVLIWYLGFEKKGAELPAIIGAFLGGIAAISLPVFLYFMIHGAVDDFITVYFYNNLFLYQGDIGKYPNRLVFFIVCLWASLHKNLEFMIPAVVGALWLMLTPKDNKKMFFVVLLSTCFLCLSTFGGGRIFEYYPMPFAVFGIYGLIAIALGIQKITAGKAIRVPAGKWAFPASIAICAAILLPVSYLLSDNTYMLSFEPEDVPQIRFAEYINRREDPTLLTYGTLDVGMYYTADVTPTCKYFCELNIPLPEMYETQNRYVEEGITDFVLSRTVPLEETGLDCSHYQLVEAGYMSFEKKDTIFYLYEKVTQ